MRRGGDKGVWTGLEPLYILSMKGLYGSAESIRTFPYIIQGNKSVINIKGSIFESFLSSSTKFSGYLSNRTSLRKSKIDTLMAGFFFFALDTASSIYRRSRSVTPDDCIYVLYTGKKAITSFMTTVRLFKVKSLVCLFFSDNRFRKCPRVLTSLDITVSIMSIFFSR